MCTFGIKCSLVSLAGEAELGEIQIYFCILSNLTYIFSYSFSTSNDSYCIVFPILGIHIHLKCLCASVSFRLNVKMLSYIQGKCSSELCTEHVGCYSSGSLSLKQLAQIQTQDITMSNTFFRNSIFEIP